MFLLVCDHDQLPNSSTSIVVSTPYVAYGIASNAKINLVVDNKLKKINIHYVCKSGDNKGLGKRLLGGNLFLGHVVFATTHTKTRTYELRAIS